MRTSRSSSRPARLTTRQGAAERPSPPEPASDGPVTDAELRLAKREIDQLKGRVRRLERSIARYEALADAAQRATIWDYALYEQVPHDEWLAIDRDDCERLIRALGSTDRWRPWRVILERRLGPV